MPQRRRRTYILAYRNETTIAQSINESEDWIMNTGTIATAFPVLPKEGSRFNHFRIDGALDEVSSNFNIGKVIFEFENCGMMSNRHVTTIATISNYNDKCLLLGDLILPENEIPTKFFFSVNDLPNWL